MLVLDAVAHKLIGNSFRLNSQEQFARPEDTHTHTQRVRSNVSLIVTAGGGSGWARRQWVEEHLSTLSLILTIA